MKRYELAVIGAGPGGYAAALDAANAGKNTVLIEQDLVGGTCLNRGCVPTKSMLHAAGQYAQWKNAMQFGIKTGEVSLDYQAMQAYCQRVQNKLRDGMTAQLQRSQVTFCLARAILLGTNQAGNYLIQLEDTATNADAQELVEAEAVILATGSKPLIPLLPGIHCEQVVTSNQMFQLQQCPNHLCIIGGGVIGVEFATIYAAFGSEVTILEAMPQLLYGMEEEISTGLKASLKRRGIQIHTNVQVLEVRSNDRKQVEVIMKEKEKEKQRSIVADVALLATGRSMEVSVLSGLPKEQWPAIEHGKIVVNNAYETNRSRLYAIGDLITGPDLAHAAMAQAHDLVALLLGKTGFIRPAIIPSCVYTEPEIASVGLTKAKAMEAGWTVSVGTAFSHANAKTQIAQKERGMIRLIVDAMSGRLLGAHLMCARATDMIGEFVTALTNQMTIDQLKTTIRPHPTYSEMIGEAIEDARRHIIS